MRVNIGLAVFFALIAAPLAAQESTPTPIVKTELLIDAARMENGQAWAGIRFTMPEGWHIYWQNPGDSGIPTTLAWTLPNGVSDGDIIWPAPHRQTMGDLVNYGYDDEVILQVPLSVSEQASGGNIQVKASWLVCHDTCIPESAVLTGTLPHTDKNAADALAKAREKTPVAFPGKASFAANDTEVMLTVTPSSAWEKPEQAEFIPLEDGVIKNNSPMALADHGTNFTITMARGGSDVPAVWHGVLRLHWSGNAPTTYALQATQGNAPLMPPGPVVPLLVILGLAFAGGLLLNIMPCVLPILSLKALALAKKAEAAPHAVRAQGLAYTFGVVLSFVLIAGVMLALKASGEAVGWGFQLQSPIMVGILCVLMLLVSLNLLGVFHLPPLLGHFMVAHEGVRGTFLTGVLAVAVATPCTAPFMATAVGATLALPAAISLMVFAAMGVGMASPFLVVSLWPAAQRALPKPGHWMHRFRQFLALPMLATACWLAYVLLQLLHPTPMRGDAGYTLIKPVSYSESALAELREKQVPVFVDATAAWCLTCKVNERVALKSEAVQRYFAEHNVTLMIADWTAQNKAIATYLATFGRNGVPLYVYYPPGASPVILPQVLTPGLVLDTLNGNMTNK